MATDVDTLQERYITYCMRQGISPNPAMLSILCKGSVKKSHQQQCNLEVSLDYLNDGDFGPLLDVFMEIAASDVDAVDICNGSLCSLNGGHALSLMRAINGKLRLVDLHDFPFGKEFLRDLSRRGLQCQVLNMRSSHFRKLNFTGKFVNLHTLNLDFSISLCTLQKDCFTCMPNLMRLSMCETRIGNLWTTKAALSKLPCLVELRFQNCLYCIDTGPCPVCISGHANCMNDIPRGEVFVRNLVALNGLFMIDEVQSSSSDSSDDSEVDFSRHQMEYRIASLLSISLPDLNGNIDLQNEVSFGTLRNQLENSPSSASDLRNFSDFVDIMLKKYITNHPSPICFEKHYREFLIASLPRLQVLDNLSIRETERERANLVFSKYFEQLPYNRQHEESVVSILQKRETRASQSFFSRSLGAAKVGSSSWPSLRPLFSLGSVWVDEMKSSTSFRPRQLEYHPSNPSLMVFGTIDGEIVVVNHETDKIVSYVPTVGAMNSVLGLCWLKKHPSKLVAGSDNGILTLFDIKHAQSSYVTFDKFELLTSVHVNSTDELIIASGYLRNVGLYDISSGKCLQVFTDMHQEHINVVKFSNHSPSIFATSSFDRDIKLWDLRQNQTRACYTSSSSRGNVMVCFSPDDHHLLVSAVDNEVKQLLAVDGRVHLNFEISPTGSPQNYTRSYYMNGRDYIISGSCDEHLVRICCARTGRRLRDISLDGKGSGTSMFVQSLRGDPFRDFHMSILAACLHSSSKSEIIKVNLLESGVSAKDFSYSCPSNSSVYSMGG